MGATTSGLAPVDPDVKSKFLMKFMNAPFEAPVGGKHLDTGHYRMCGDEVCINDPSSTGDFLWEQVRREGVVSTASTAKIHKIPSAKIEQTVGYPDTKVRLYDASKPVEIGGDVPTGAKTYVIRLDKSRFM